MAYENIDDVRAEMTPLPFPFAGRTSVPSVPQTGTEWSLETGIGENFAKSKGNGGKFITRGMVNAIGNMGTQCQFFEQCGGYWTFNQGVCDAIKGYPKGAILRFYDASSGLLRTVRSLHDDNDWNFIEKGVDGKTHWAFADDCPEVDAVVDYSTGENITDSFIVDSGEPEPLEIPYDCQLIFSALGYIDTTAMMRDQYFPMYRSELNGNYFAYADGVCYLDIYEKNTVSAASIPIALWNPYTFTLVAAENNVSSMFGQKGCPLTSLSASVFLSKGDKVRLRNVVTEAIGGLISVQGTGGTNSVKDFVDPMVWRDDSLERKYLFKSASLFKRSYSL